MQNLLNLNTSLLPPGFVPKLPPSDLGFVCKPELPPHINILFRARPPLPYIPIHHKKIRRSYTGVFDLADDENPLSHFEQQKTNKLPEKPPKLVLKHINIIKNIERSKRILKENEKKWKPEIENKNCTGNPFKTLFVYRIDKRANDEELKFVFEEFGNVKMAKIVRNKIGKSKGYGFVEFEHGKDFREALRRGSRKKIFGKHVHVDKERGRTDERFKPRKCGGGKGRCKDRELPEWIEEGIEKVKKMYPELVKEALDSVRK